jgi:NDP-sugar pyrophosphorylase family protein
MNADLLTAVGFDHLLQFHADQGAEATMCARELTSQVPYGVIRFDGPRLTKIEEKPTQRYFVNAGIYALSPTVFDLVAKDRPLDMPDLFATLLQRKRSAAVFPIREYWMDIGQVDDLQRARDEFEAIFGS